MTKHKGFAVCPKDGEFPWRGYHIYCREYISFKVERDVQNFDHIEDDGRGIAICPICKGMISIFVKL